MTGAGSAQAGPAFVVSQAGFRLNGDIPSHRASDAKPLQSAREITGSIVDL